MSKHGPNVTKLITKFIAREAVPPGGGLGSAVEFFSNQEHRKKVLEAAETKALQAIELIKSAPDNPYGNDDEQIAGELLKLVSQRESRLTWRAADGGSVPVFDGESLMECGHELKFIVYSERRNYCAVCGADAHPVGVPFSPTRRR